MKQQKLLMCLHLTQDQQVLHIMVFWLTSRDDINLKNLHVYIIYDSAITASLNIYMSDCPGW